MIVLALAAIGIAVSLIGLARLFIVKRAAKLHFLRPGNNFEVLTDRTIK